MKQYGVKIPVSGYTTIWVEAEDEKEAIKKAIDGESEMLCEPEDELDWNYKNEEEIQVTECIE